MLVDHHCHLDVPEFAADLDGVVGRAKAAGVGVIVSISMLMRRLGDTLRIAEAYPNVFCSVGTHPHYAHTELDIPVEEIVRLVGASQDRGDRRGRARLFLRQQPARGADAGLSQPHRRGAGDAGCRSSSMRAMPTTTSPRSLEEEMAKRRFSAVLHCFTGGAELARRALDLGLYISFSGILTFKKSDALREIAAAVPLDRLLVETDAPYLAPGKYRGKRNEPAYVVHTASRARRGSRASRRRSWRGPPPTTSSGSMPRRRGRRSRHEHALHHPGLRLLRRRAAHRQHLGQLRSGQPEEPAAALRAAGRAVRQGRHHDRAGRHAARHPRAAARRAGRRPSTACSSRTTMPTTRTASTTCAACSSMPGAASTSMPTRARARP